MQRYLHDTEIDSHGLCAYEWNLYVPISGDCFLIRCFDPEWTGPKWIKRGDLKHYYVQCPLRSSTIVIVEDCISAIVVSRARDSVALLGTYMSDHTLAWIADKKYSRAMVWLDDDNTKVRTAQNKIRDRLSLVIPKVEICHMGTDPKNEDMYSRAMVLS